MAIAPAVVSFERFVDDVESLVLDPVHHLFPPGIEELVAGDVAFHDLATVRRKTCATSDAWTASRSTSSCSSTVK